VEKFDKLEEKIDKVKEDVAELKTDFKVHAEKMSNKMEIFEDHITGDKKIINELQPVLEKLPTIVEIAEQYQFEKRLKQENIKKIKTWSIRIGFIGTIVGVLTAVINFYEDIVKLFIS
jgi:hypothetical protein